MPVFYVISNQISLFCAKIDIHFANIDMCIEIRYEKLQDEKKKEGLSYEEIQLWKDHESN